MTLLVWEMSAIVQWLAHSVVLPLGIGMRIDFSSPVATAGSFIFADMLNAPSRWHHQVLNSSTGISSHPLALLVLFKAHLTSHSRMSGSVWLTTPS